MSETIANQYALNDYINHFKELNEEDLYYLNFMKRKQDQKKYWIKD